MKQLLRIFKFFTLRYKNIFPKFFAAMIFINMIDLFAKIEIFSSMPQKAEKLCFHSNQIILFSCLMIGLGIIYASRDFSGYIKIRAKRGEFLKGFLLWSIALSILTTIGNRIGAFILGGMVLSVTEIPGALFCKLTFIEEIMTYVVSIQSGFLIGALYYRLRKISFYLLAIALVYIQLYRLLNNIPLGGGLRTMAGGVGNGVIVEGCTSLIAMGISSFLLYKAATIEYAHDVL